MCSYSKNTEVISPCKHTIYLACINVYYVLDNYVLEGKYTRRKYFSFKLLRIFRIGVVIALIALKRLFLPLVWVQCARLFDQAV